MKYNLKEFNADFPDDAACLDFIFRTRYPDGGKCECGKSDCFHRIAGRRAYSCAWCGAQIYPTAGTIFHKSETPLRLWFFGIFLFSQSKNGVAAAELMRQLGVTYKTAHRMGHKIRALMHGGKDMLAGICEADETYVGGKRRGKRGRGAEGKTPVVGIAMRRGGRGPRLRPIFHPPSFALRRLAAARRGDLMAPSRDPMLISFWQCGHFMQPIYAMSPAIFHRKFKVAHYRAGRRCVCKSR